MGAFDVERVNTYSSRVVFSSGTSVNSEVLPLQKLRAVLTVAVQISNVQGSLLQVKVRCRTTRFLPTGICHSELPYLISSTH
jgi:hypothetical protein